MWETRVQSLGQEDPLEKEMVTHSSTLAWKIPSMEEPGRLQSMGSQRVGHDWVTLLTPMANIFGFECHEVSVAAIQLCYFSTKQLQITYQQMVITVFRIKYMIWTTLFKMTMQSSFFFLPKNDQEFQNINSSAPNQMGGPSKCGALWLRRLHTYEARLDCAQRKRYSLKQVKG